MVSPQVSSQPLPQTTSQQSVFPDSAWDPIPQTVSSLKSPYGQAPILNPKNATKLQPLFPKKGLQADSPKLKGRAQTGGVNSSNINPTNTQASSSSYSTSSTNVTSSASSSPSKGAPFTFSTGSVSPASFDIPTASTTSAVYGQGGSYKSVQSTKPAKLPANFDALNNYFLDYVYPKTEQEFSEMYTQLITALKTEVEACTKAYTAGKCSEKDCMVIDDKRLMNKKFMGGDPFDVRKIQVRKREWNSILKQFFLGWALKKVFEAFETEIDKGRGKTFFSTKKVDISSLKGYISKKVVDGSKVYFKRSFSESCEKIGQNAISGVKNGAYLGRILLEWKNVVVFSHGLRIIATMLSELKDSDLIFQDVLDSRLLKGIGNQLAEELISNFLILRISNLVNFKGFEPEDQPYPLFTPAQFTQNFPEHFSGFIKAHCDGITAVGGNGPTLGKKPL